MLTGIIYREGNKYEGRIRQGFIPIEIIQNITIEMLYFTAEAIPIGKEIEAIFEKYRELQVIEIRTDQRTGELYFTITLNGLTFNYPPDSEVLSTRIHCW